VNLLHAWKTLIESGQPVETTPEPTPPTAAMAHLVAHAWECDVLRTTHPWELDPAVCRELDKRYGYTPAGTWSRLAGLAAGADVLHATTEGFVALPSPADFAAVDPDVWRRRMLEAFTKRLIPPAAAAAL